MIDKIGIITADKIKVKSIIKEIVGEAYTVPTLKVFENIEDFCLNIKKLNSSIYFKD